MERAALQAEIARLQNKLASKSQAPAKKTASEKTAARQVLAEIEDMEETIAGMYADDDSEDEDDDDAITADDDDDDDDDDDEEEDEEKTASLGQPGIEDEITDDKFHEVERVRPETTVQTSGPSMLSVAPTKYMARLKEASARLDRVAGYLEKHGRNKLAFRIDKIADAIDAQIKKAEEA